MRNIMMEMETHNENQEVITENTNDNEPVLYAGKFDTVEKLENGYKESLSVHIKNKELEEKINLLTKVPENYAVPDDIKLDESSISDIAELSKKASLTQNQFEEIVRKKYSDTLNAKNKFEERKFALGEEKINLLNTYIENNFGQINENIKSQLVTNLINDDQSINAILLNRENQLNSTVPGMEHHANQEQRFNIQDELKKASRDAAANPGNAEAKARYIELCNQAAKLNK